MRRDTVARQLSNTLLGGTGLKGVLTDLEQAGAPSPMPPPEVQHPAPLRAPRALQILATFIAAQFVSALIVAIPVAVYFAPATPDPQQLAAKIEAVSLIPAIWLGAVSGTFLVFRMTRRTLPGRIASGVLNPIGWSTCSVRSIAVAASIGLVLSFIFIYLLVPRFPPRPDQSFGPLTQAAATPGLTRLSWAILVLAVAPPVEEFLFRGVLLEGFTQSWNQTGAAIAVTALFIASHLLEVGTFWVALASISAMAVAAVIVRLITRSLLPAIALHFAYNLVPVITVYAGV